MNNELFQKIAAEFAVVPISSLVDSFNNGVGNNGWCSARAYHDTALLAEFENRGIDTSAVYDGKTISFRKRVSLHDNRLVLIE